MATLVTFENECRGAVCFALHPPLSPLPSDFPRTRPCLPSCRACVPHFQAFSSCDGSELLAVSEGHEGEREGGSEAD